MSTAGEMFRSLLMSARPKQWTKNLLVYLAVFFTINEAWDPGDFVELVSVVGRATLALIIFSVLSGAAYLVNDIVDVEWTGGIRGSGFARSLPGGCPFQSPDTPPRCWRLAGWRERSRWGRCLGGYLADTSPSCWLTAWS